jgi:thymidylate synthase (FAD)
MGKMVKQKVYWIGQTGILGDGLRDYLCDSGNEGFAESIDRARAAGLSDGEILISFYAKLCYASLTLGKNDNLTRVRDIPENLAGTLKQGHGSVWEHAVLNFVVRNCSRVFETELVRHRAGTAFSILSGRFERVDYLDIVFDPILEPIRGRCVRLQHLIEDEYRAMVKEMDLEAMTDHDLKKRVTSALRRFLPQGKAREVGFSLNLRALRHVVQMRTGRHSEWEIRDVFAQVFHLVRGKHPLLFHDAKTEEVRGITEVSGMKMQPYEKDRD